MPGFSFAYRLGGSGVPVRNDYPLAKSMNGVGTPPAAAMQAGDVVVYTTASALTDGGVAVVRPLLAADKSANYENGSGLRCGILGICDCGVSTDSTGVVMAAASLGGVISPNPGMASMNPLSLNGHSVSTFVIADASTIFRADLATAAANANAFEALKGTLAGITITVTNGVTVYTVDTAATGEAQCLYIYDIDVSDTTYKKLLVGVYSAAGLTPVSSYLQSQTNVPYTAQ